MKRLATQIMLFSALYPLGTLLAWIHKPKDPVMSAREMWDSIGRGVDAADAALAEERRTR